MLALSRLPEYEANRQGNRRDLSRLPQGPSHRAQVEEKPHLLRLLALPVL